MSTDTIWQTVTTSSEQTEQLGHNIGARLRGGEVIELRSDLGGGKTTFTRGLAAGMGSHDAVASPSFTISKVYESKTLELHHYDFYRLADAGLMAQELHEVLNDPRCVTVLEWAQTVEDVLPESHVVVTISATGENNRDIHIELPEKYRYLKEGES